MTNEADRGYDFAVEDIRSLTVIWAALCGGVVLYTLTVFGLIVTGAVAGTLPGRAMWIAVPFVLVWMTGLIFARRSVARTLVRAVPPEQRFDKYRVFVIALLAMMEFGGLMLITVGLMTAEAGWVLAGGGAAAFLMLRARPSLDELKGES